MSDDLATEAEAFLNAPATASTEDAATEPEEVPTESDHQDEPVVEPVAAPEGDADPVAEKLPEDHNPDATLEESTPVQEEKQPQFRVDAKNLAEKWDSLSESEQSVKLERLKKSGRTSTLGALAEELGTSPEKLSKAYNPQEDEIAALREQLEELKSVIPTAQRQAEMDRYQVEVAKWAEHNKFSKEETESVVGLDSDVRKKFEALKFDPESGEKLTLKGRLRLALSQSETAQEAVAAKKAGIALKGIQAGLDAKMPGTGDTAQPSSTSWEHLEGEDLLEAQDRAAGVRKWR